MKKLFTILCAVVLTAVLFVLPAAADTPYVAYWSFDNDATEQFNGYTPTNPEDLTLVDGKNGKAYGGINPEDGTGAIYFENVDIPIISGFTVSCWAQSDFDKEYNGYFVFMAKNQKATDGHFEFFILPDGAFGCYGTNANPVVSLKSTFPVDDAEWHHYAVTMSEGLYTLYIDGNLEATYEGDYLAQAAGPLALGSLVDKSLKSQTYMDDLFFSNVVVPEEDIAKLMENTGAYAAELSTKTDVVVVGADDIAAMEEARLAELQARADQSIINIEKTEFLLGENIMVSASGTGEKDWIAIYNDDVKPDGSYLKWFYVKDSSEGPVNLQNCGGKVSGQLPAGDYDLYYLYDDGYEAAKKIDIKVVDPNAAPPVSPEGYVAYWSFDENGDETYNGYTPKNPDALTLVDGKAGKAYGGAGADASGVLYYENVDIPMMEKFTFTCWANGSKDIQTGGYYVFFAKNAKATNGHFEFFFKPDGTSAVYSTNATETFSFVTETAMDDAAWHHYAVVGDNGKYQFYVDGELAAEKEGAVLKQATGTVSFGGLLDGSLPSMAMVDELLITTEVLSAEEIAKVMADTKSYAEALKNGTAPAETEAPETEAPVAVPVTLTTDKTEYTVGESIMVTATGDGAKDWIGLYPVDAVPGDGGSAWQWFYVTESQGNPFDMKSYDGSHKGEDLPAGDYVLYYLFNDGYDIGATMNITIKDAAPAETAAPETAAPEVVTPAETAPQTFDAGIIAAAAAIVSAAGYAISKKRR